MLRARAKAGDLVQIVKTYRGKQVLFSAQCLSDGAEPQPPSSLRGNYLAGTATNVHQMPPQMSNAEARNAAFFAHREPQNGNGHAPEPQPQRQPQPLPAAVQPASKHLMSCLCAAIDAASQAQEYARTKGLGLTFLGGDIRAIALSIYIGDRRDDA